MVRLGNRTYQWLGEWQNTRMVFWIIHWEHRATNRVNSVLSIE